MVPPTPSEHDLDAGYAQLASAFNSDPANVERRTARDDYARRSEDQLRHFID